MKSPDYRVRLSSVSLSKRDVDRIASIVCDEIIKVVNREKDRRSAETVALAAQLEQRDVEPDANELFFRATRLMGEIREREKELSDAIKRLDDLGGFGTPRQQAEAARLELRRVGALRD